MVVPGGDISGDQELSVGGTLQTERERNDRTVKQPADLNIPLRFAHRTKTHWLVNDIVNGNICTQDQGKGEEI